MKTLPCGNCNRIAEIFCAKMPSADYQGDPEYGVSCKHCGDIIVFPSNERDAIESWYAGSMIPMPITIYREKSA